MSAVGSALLRSGFKTPSRDILLFIDFFAFLFYKNIYQA
jgi:hypothetical protein